MTTLDVRNVQMSQAAAPATTVPAGTWSYLPTLSLVGALALLLIAAANTAARNGLAWATAAFWLGLCVLIIPAAARLLSARASRRERLGLALGLALGLYLVKIFQSPLAFTYHDEFIHWRTAQDILNSGRLFTVNPLITVSPFFPGLQIATSALAQVAGLSVFGAGVLVLAAARIMLVLALFLLAEELSGSARIAGIAALLYMANPNFLFFTAQYAYESLALPFAVLTLFLAVRRARSSGWNRFGLNLLLLISLATTVVSHHMTAYALTALLVLWSFAPTISRTADRLAAWCSAATRPWPLRLLGRLLLREQEPAAHGDARSAEVTLLALVLSLTWLVYVAILVLAYLGPVLTASVRELLRLLEGVLPSRQLFRDYAGNRPPLIEQLLGFGSVLCVLAGLPFGLLVCWRRFSRQPFALTLMLGALAYPVALALRLTQAGAETSNRSSEFLFLPLAFVLATAIGARRLPQKALWHWFRSTALLGWAAIMLIGGAIVGSPPWARLPEGYAVSADMRSIEPEGITAATWAEAQLGPNHRVGTDRINRLLMASYGEQRVLTNLSEGLNVAFVFFAPTFGTGERSIMCRTGAEYLVVDRRLSTGLPLSGVYFEQGEPDSNHHTTPISAQALAKFDSVPGIARVFDSGNLVIYDTRKLPCSPGTSILQP